MKRRILSGAIALIFLSTTGAANAASPYTLKVVAKPGDTIGGKTLTGLGYPAINNSGTVAFTGLFSNGGVPASGIFTQSRVVAKPGDTIDGKTLVSAAFPTINDFGTIAFLGSFSDSSLAIVTAQLFAGTPGAANCHGKSVSALSQYFGGMPAAAAALGFSSAQALQNIIETFCQ